MKKKVIRLTQRHPSKESENTRQHPDMAPDSSEFIFNMFKYVANMLMLMNGGAAITLLNNNPPLYQYSIVSLATGCLVSVVFYVFAYFAYCDMVFPNPKYSGDIKKKRYKYFAIANYCIMISFVVSIFAFYAGLILFLP